MTKFSLRKRINLKTLKNKAKLKIDLNQSSPTKASNNSVNPNVNKAVNGNSNINSIAEDPSSNIAEETPSSPLLL